MLADVLKGWTATQAATFLVYAKLVPEDDLVIYQIVMGMAAVLGHVFPIYAGFKGGKGVATLLGMVFSIHIIAALICVGVFVIVLLLSKYVSLGSMLASLTFPILLSMPRFKPEDYSGLVIAFGFVIFALVVLTHQKNIKRLINGEENKAKIRIIKKRDRR